MLGCHRWMIWRTVDEIVKYVEPNFMMCLLGGKIEWMKNFGQKIEMKIFFECVLLDGNEGK